jgi:predicted component of type VI protein secretion system
MTTQTSYRLVGNDGTIWTVSEGQSLALGRAVQNDIVIADPRVSRKHATLLVQRGCCWIGDEGSMHGTFVNGQRLAGRQELQAGDAVQIGSAVYHLQPLGLVPARPTADRRASRRQAVIWALGGALAGVVVIAIVLVVARGGGEQARLP